MALVLSKTAPAAVKIDLGGSASICVRPCTSIEYYAARAEVSTITAAIATGGLAWEKIVAILGDDFSGKDLALPHYIEAIAERLVLLKLAMICADGWTGVEFAEKVPAEFNEANLALLLRDPLIADAVRQVVNRGVHQKELEKNG